MYGICELVYMGRFRKSTHSTESAAGTWCAINQTIKSIPFEHAHSDQCGHDWAVDLTQESPRLSGKRYNISLASSTTNWETHLSVRLHSHRSAAWKPGQNHDYQLHSSPNPVRRNRENNRLDEQKKSLSLCQWKFDHFIMANQTKIYPQSCHTEEDKPPRRWSTEARMGKEDRLMMNKQPHMCYRQQRIRGLNARLRKLSPEVFTCERVFVKTSASVRVADKNKRANLLICMWYFLPRCDC